MDIDYRRLLIPLTVGVVGLVAVALFWAAIQPSVRWGLWSTIAERPLTKGELRRLNECRPPSWWTWLKVLSQDREVRCGESFATEAIAAKINSGDREAWLAEWVASTQASPMLRLRAATALNVAGRSSPTEPAWLSLDPSLPTVSGAGYATAAAEEREWAVHLGPRWVALGELWSLSESGADFVDAILPLEAIAAIGDPSVDRLVASVVARGLGVPSDLPDDQRYRRTRGLPPTTLPDGWARAILSRNRCAPPCLDLWIALLTMEAEAVQGDPIDHPESIPTLQPLAEHLRFAGTRRRALEWWIRAATQWVAAAPDPAARLATLGHGGPGGSTDPLKVVWDRSAAPFTTATVMVEIGRRTGVAVEVRVDGGGSMWIQVGTHQVVRPSCGGTPAAEAPEEAQPWPWLALVAGSLAESAVGAAATDPTEAMRLATAAGRLDPLMADGLSDRLATVEEVSEATRLGQGIGVRFRTTGAPPSGAEASRTAMATRIGGCL